MSSNHALCRVFLCIRWLTSWLVPIPSSCRRTTGSASSLSPTTRRRCGNYANVPYNVRFDNIPRRLRVFATSGRHEDAFLREVFLRRKTGVNLFEGAIQPIFVFCHFCLFSLWPVPQTRTSLWRMTFSGATSGRIRAAHAASHITKCRKNARNCTKVEATVSDIFQHNFSLLSYAGERPIG